MADDSPRHDPLNEHCDGRGDGFDTGVGEGSHSLGVPDTLKDTNSGNAVEKASATGAELKPAGQTSVVDIASLIVDHHADVYRYALRLSGSLHNAEDLTQQAFLLAHRNLAQLRSAEQGRSWLLTIVRNCFLKERRRSQLPPAAWQEIDWELIADATTAAQSLKIREIDDEQLRTALDELPDTFRIVLLMFYFEERSYREIADELGVPVGTVMSRLSRTKQHLRTRLTAELALAAPITPAKAVHSGRQK